MKKKERVVVYLSKKTYEKAREETERRGMSLSALMRMLLKEHLEKNRK